MHYWCIGSMNGGTDIASLVRGRDKSGPYGCLFNSRWWTIFSWSIIVIHQGLFNSRWWTIFSWSIIVIHQAPVVACSIGGCTDYDCASSSGTLSTNSAFPLVSTTSNILIRGSRCSDCNCTIHVRFLLLVSVSLRCA